MTKTYWNCYVRGHLASLGYSLCRIVYEFTLRAARPSNNVAVVQAILEVSLRNLPFEPLARFAEDGRWI